MTHQIARFSPHQTAKTMAAMYLAIGLGLIPVFLAIAVAAPSGLGFSKVLIVLLPLAYALIGYVVVALGCTFYNWIAGFTGGIEFDLETDEAARPS